MQNSCVFRRFCCPSYEGTRGKAVHQAEETSGILGSISLSEPVGFHHSGAGRLALSLHEHQHHFILLPARQGRAIKNDVCCFRQMSTGPPLGRGLSTTWTWLT